LNQLESINTTAKVLYAPEMKMIKVD
jgi:hypothetical protein